MGLLRNILGGNRTPLVDVAAGATFSADVDSGVLYGTPTLEDYIYGNLGRVRRTEALTVPAVKRARDLVAGSIGTLPLGLAGDNVPAEGWPFLENPEADVAGSVTWTRIAEDLLFHGVAWLRVTHVGWHNLPVEAVRLDPATVSVRPGNRVYRSVSGSGTAEEWIPDHQLIRIDSPNEGLLTAGATAIRTCVALSRTTNRAAAGLPPMTYFTPADGVDTLEDEDVTSLLDDWQKARTKGLTGYVPGGLKLEALGWNPEQLQLTELRDHAVLEIARLAGVDGEELGVSTTSRTYFNAWDRKQNFIQFTLAGYLAAIEGRLSRDDVTPRGMRAKFNLDDFFKADTLARYQAYEVGLRTNALTLDEVRDAESKPRLTPDQVRDTTKIRATATDQEPANVDA